MQDRCLQSNGGDPSTWVDRAIAKDKKTVSILELPTKADGKEYSLDDLKDDQSQAVALVLENLKQWLECDSDEDFAGYKPLRITIMGAGGSGKSVIINTLVTVLRKAFQHNGCCEVLAPTGTAACNVGGETIHHYYSMGVREDYTPPMSTGSFRYEKLMQKGRTLLAMIIDEKSLLSSNLVGSAAQMTAETLYGGFNKTVSWGGLPVVVIVGDDSQLPSIDKGALSILSDDVKANPKRMETKGEAIFLELAGKVFELAGSKRVQKHDNTARALNDRLRDGKPSDEDIRKLQSLSMKQMRKVHGDGVVDLIERDALYLFAYAAPIKERNLTSVARVCDATNPIAVVKSRSTGINGRGIHKHFDSGTPVSTVLAREAKVAIIGRNFYPKWGLHNGACGTVKEIVFARGQNPNRGDLPSYVVVDFPAYSGPAWDSEHPQVRDIVAYPIQ